MTTAMIREIRSFEAIRITVLKLQRTHKTNKHTKKNTNNSHSKLRVKTKQTPTTTNQKTTKHTDPKLKKHIMISIIKPTFSWQHIDVQLLVKKSILCCLRKSSCGRVWAHINFVGLPHLYNSCLTKEQNRCVFRMMI